MTFCVNICFQDCRIVGVLCTFVFVYLYVHTSVSIKFEIILCEFKECIWFVRGFIWHHRKIIIKHNAEKKNPCTQSEHLTSYTSIIVYSIVIVIVVVVLCQTKKTTIQDRTKFVVDVAFDFVLALFLFWLNSYSISKYICEWIRSNCCGQSTSLMSKQFDRPSRQFHYHYILSREFTFDLMYSQIAMLNELFIKVLLIV